MKIETVLCASIICVCVYVCVHIYIEYIKILPLHLIRPHGTESVLISGNKNLKNIM